VLLLALLRLLLLSSVCGPVPLRPALSAK
jgi:hypothetical protein